MTNRFHKLELEPSRQQAELPLKSSTSQDQQHDLHDASHWMGTADRSRRSGLFEDALRYYSRAVERDRSLVRGWVGQVQMLIALAEFREAELWARKALELFRNHAELQAARAQALGRDGDIKQAQAACDAALAQPGESPYPWMVRGDLMLARKDALEQHCFDKAVQLDHDWLVLIEIAAIYLYYRRYANALVRCRQAVEQAPDQAYCWYQQGYCQSRMGLGKPARLSLKQCLDLEPKHAQARQCLKELDGSGPVKRALGRFFGRG